MEKSFKTIAKAKKYWEAKGYTLFDNEAGLIQTGRDSNLIVLLEGEDIREIGFEVSINPPCVIETRNGKQINYYPLRKL